MSRRTDRFQAATELEFNDFAEEQECLNNKRSTQNALNLLSQYKVQAFDYTQSYDAINRDDLVFLLKSFYQKVRKENGDPYEPGSLRTMHYGILRHLRDECKIDFSSAENRDIVKHLGVVNKSLRKQGKGSLPNKSDALANQETVAFFEQWSASKHHPRTFRMQSKYSP